MLLILTLTLAPLTAFTMMFLILATMSSRKIIVPPWPPDQFSERPADDAEVIEGELVDDDAPMFVAAGFFGSGGGR